LCVVVHACESSCVESINRIFWFSLARAKILDPIPKITKAKGARGMT
jgi:hypothetical protein